jgi:integrase
MPLLQFDARSIKRCVALPGGRQAEYFDTLVRGLTLRVTGATERSPGGRKVWTVIYQVAGQRKRTRYTIGGFPTYDIGQARDEAAEILRAAARGVDLGAERKAKRRPVRTVRATRGMRTVMVPAGGQRKAAATMGELIEEYVTRHAVKKRSGDNDVRMLYRELLGIRPNGEPIKGCDVDSWQDLPTARPLHVIRADAVEVLDRIEARGSPRARNIMKAYLGRMFRFGIERGLVAWDANPMRDVSLLRARMKETDALDDDQIRLFWTVLDSAAMDDNLKRALRLMLVTGQRPGEVMALRQGAIGRAPERTQFGGLVWTITPENYKTGDLTGQGNTIPLTPLALELIGPRRPTKDSLIFASETGEAYDEDAARQAVYRLFKVKGARAGSAAPLLAGLMPRFTPRALRTTASTIMNRLLGVEYERLIDRVLGHVQQDIGSKHYNDHHYLPEKLRALTALADHVAALLALPPSNVVQLREVGR